MRYVVTELEGYLTAGHRVPGLTVSVLDRAVCHRPVFQRRTEDEYQGWVKRQAVRAGASARCDELNAA